MPLLANFSQLQLQFLSLENFYMLLPCMKSSMVLRFSTLCYAHRERIDVLFTESSFVSETYYIISHLSRIIGPKIVHQSCVHHTALSWPQQELSRCLYIAEDQAASCVLCAIFLCSHKYDIFFFYFITAWLCNSVFNL